MTFIVSVKKTETLGTKEHFHEKQDKRTMNLNYYIKGKGAVGHILYEKLSQIGLNVTMMGRGKSLLDHRSLEEGGSSLFIVCTKAYQVEEAIKEILNEALVFQDANSLVVSANGLPTQVSFFMRDLFPRVNIRPGLVSFGAAFSESLEKYIQTSKGGFLGFGATAPYDLTPAEKMLFNLGPDFIKIYLNQTEINEALYKKWLFNVSLNILCGGLGLNKNEDALNHLNVLRQLFDEGWRLGSSLGYLWQSEREAYWQELINLIHDTGKNTNSMRVDLKLRRQTEIDYFLPGDFDKIGKLFPTLKEFRQKILMQGVTP